MRRIANIRVPTGSAFFMALAFSFRRADPNWSKKLTPVLSEARRLVSTLLGLDSTFLKMLAETKCLTECQTDEISRICSGEGKTEATKRLFKFLTIRPTPYFDTFCNVLGEVHHGEALRSLLLKG